ncbi:hypothetical protein P7C70_g8295, partial [Phenoliferia sp. Uapishka_3]
MKRGRSTASFGHGTRGEKELIDFAHWLGIPSRRARGEAEAELAVLCKDGHIDGVLSRDGDTLLFGAPLLVSNFSTSTNSETTELKKEALSILTLERIKLLASTNEDLPIATYSLADLTLSQADMVLFAVLIGGDYDTQGLKGCGATVVQALVKMGESAKLQAAYEAAAKLKEEPAKRDEVLKRWRNAVADVISRGLSQSTEDGIAVRKYPSLVETLRTTDNFPSFDVLSYLFDPSVNRLSRNATPINLSLDVKVTQIITSMNNQHHWPSWRCLAHFHKLILPALVLRDLHLSISSTTPPSSIVLTSTLKNHKKKAGRPDMVHAYFECPAYGAALVAAASSLPSKWERDERNGTHIVNGTVRNHKDPYQIEDPAVIDMWVPVPLLDLVYPDWRTRSSKPAANNSQVVSQADSSKKQPKEKDSLPPAAGPSNTAAPRTKKPSTTGASAFVKQSPRILTHPSTIGKGKAKAIVIDDSDGSDEDFPDIEEVLRARATSASNNLAQSASERTWAQKASGSGDGTAHSKHSRKRSRSSDAMRTTTTPPTTPPGLRARKGAAKSITISSSPPRVPDKIILAKVSGEVILLDDTDEEGD